MQLSSPSISRLFLAGALLVSFCGCPGEVPQPGSAPNGSGKTGAKRIVILTNGDDPFWDACEAGAMKAEEELGLAGQGYTVSFDRADFTDKGQVDKIKQYAMQKDLVGFGISVFNPDSTSVARELKALQDRGVKVITIDGDVNREKYRDLRYAYIGTDNVVAGKELGRSAKAVNPKGGKVAFFVGNAGAANAINRMSGFLEGAGPDFVEVERLDDRGDRTTARKYVQDALDRHPDINSLVGIWAYNTPQIASVVKDRNLRSKTNVYCFDAAEGSIQAMKDGNVDVMVVQNPYQMGFIGVQLLKALVEKDDAFVQSLYPHHAHEGTNDIYSTELRIVVPNAETSIKKDLFEPGTIYMELKEFEAWLKERKLLSS